MPELFPPTLGEMIECIDRELRLRAIVYPRRVSDRRMSQAKADREVELMRAIRTTLDGLRSPKR